VRPEVTEYAFEDLNRAVRDPAEGRLAGSAVLRVSP
jgi:hypothetical protein